MQSILALMRHFSIRLRMQAAVAAVLLMFAVVGVVGVLAGKQVTELNSHFMEHSVEEIQTVAALRQKVAQVRALEKQMVIDYEDGVAVLKAQEAWTALLQDTRKVFEALLAGEEDEDNVVAREAVKHLTSYAERAKPVLQSIQNGAYDNARVADRMLAKAKAEMAQIEAAVDRIDAITQAEVKETQKEFHTTINHAFLAYLVTLAGVVVVVVPLTLLNSHSITSPIAYAAKVANAIAQGDLSQNIRVQGKDESANLLAALDRMQVSLREVVGQVHQTALTINHASIEVASGNSDLSQRTEQAASALQQTAGSMAQLTGTVQHSASSAHQARDLAASAAQVAERGGAAVTQVVQTMEAINHSSKKIADIIGTIDGIAFQTNILALNAAVEAARAGEQGRGFAVVAAEVRSLAQRSATSAREIKSLIGSSVESVETGSRQVADAGQTMTEIVASVQRVTSIIGEIANAAGEQSTGIGQVNQAVTDLEHMTQQNAALVEQSAAAADSLKDQAQRLSQVVGTFKLGAAS